MKKPLITNIQKYSIHDGTGIRTTVFFKGCPLSCRWCHNPETQQYTATVLSYEERCTGCGACVAVCPGQAIHMEEFQTEQGQMGRKAVTNRTLCTGCGVCTDECLQNAREVCGTEWEIPKLVQEVLKDQAFYETSGGGVTLSGGEVLAQDMDYIEQLMKQLKGRGIRIFVDTCGAVPFSHFERVLPYADNFLYDIKIFDEEKHKKYIGKENRQILDNLKKLSEQGASVWIRIPVIGGVNDTDEEIGAIGRFLKENQIRYGQVNLLPYHNTGSGKYGHLNREYEGKEFTVPDQEKMDHLKALLEAEGIGPVLIGG